MVKYFPRLLWFNVIFVTFKAIISIAQGLFFYSKCPVTKCYYIGQIIVSDSQTVYDVPCCTLIHKNPVTSAIFLSTWMSLVNLQQKKLMNVLSISSELDTLNAQLILRFIHEEKWSTSNSFLWTIVQPISLPVVSYFCEHSQWYVQQGQNLKPVNSWDHISRQETSD